MVPGPSPIDEVLAYYTGPESNTEAAVKLLVTDLMEWAEGLGSDSAEYLALVDAITAAAEGMVKKLVKEKQESAPRRPPLRLL